MWTCTGKRQPSSLASPFNHASNAHPAERLATLIDEDVGPLGPISLLHQRRSQASETRRPCPVDDQPDQPILVTMAIALGPLPFARALLGQIESHEIMIHVCCVDSKTPLQGSRIENL